MQIINLQSDNIKRIKAVEITPDGSIVEITGRNAQGKTSVLDSIAYALGGTKLVPAKPIRDGAKSAQVTVDLGEIKVVRKFTQKGSTISVYNKDGKVIPGGAQGVLNKMLGDLTFDPPEFTNMKPGDQRETLLGMVDLGFDPDQMELERKELYTDRRDVNRDVKELEALVGAIQPMPKVPKEEVSVSTLVENVNIARDIAREVEEINEDLRDAADCISGAKAKIAELTETIANQEAHIKSRRAQRETLTIPDISAIEAQIDGAEETNRAVRKQQERKELNTKLKAKRTATDALTNSIETLDAQKENALADVSFPIAGLGFDEDGVTYKGLALEQASSAEQLRVSLSIAMAANPQIRVILVRDGSLLDSDNMAVIKEMAEGNDYQIWVERVDESGKVGFVIEDGELKEAAGEQSQG